jgi:acetylglutamate kinase
VGDIDEVRPAILQRLVSQELVPVVATIGTDETGQAYNINADTAAGAIAEALGAEKLVYLTDVEGLRRRAADPASVCSTVTVDELDAMIADGLVAGGMVPKAMSCLRALKGGVGHAHILDGRVAHALLLEVFTRSGIGTMVER